MVIKAKNLHKHLGKIIIIPVPTALRNEQKDVQSIKAKIMAVGDAAAVLQRVDNGFMFRVPLSDDNLKIKLADES